MQREQQPDALRSLALPLIDEANVGRDIFMTMVLEKLPKIEAGLDLLVIHPPPWGPDSPPLGPLALTTFLVDHGLQVQLLDLNAELATLFPEGSALWGMDQAWRWSTPQYFSDIQNMLDSVVRSRASHILAAAPRLIGLSATYGKELVIKYLLKIFRSLGYSGRIILGGPGVFLAEDRRAYASDEDLICGYVVGEGERATLDLLRIPEVDWASRQSPLLGTATPIDMEYLPCPNPLLIHKYLYAKPHMMVEWSRGCVRTCRFCEMEILWGRYRSKSATQRVAELKHFYEVHGYSVFHCADPAVNGRYRTLMETCKQLRALALPIRWTGHLMISPAMSSEDFLLLAASGCAKVGFGVESGSERVLALMHKKTSLAAVERNVRDAHEAGLFVEIFLMVGYPGECEEDVLATIALLRKNRPYIDAVRSINTVTVQHASALWRERSTLGIEYHGRLVERDHDWSFGSDNTLEERRRRQQRILDVLNELGLSHHHAAGHDEFNS